MEIPADIGPELYSKEWHDERIFKPGRTPEIVFGASEAAALCGRSKFKSALRLYLEKRGNIEPKETTFRMEMGHRLEKVVLDMFQETVKGPMKRPIYSYRSRHYPLIGASPDGIIRVKQTNICVEAKTASMMFYDPQGGEGNKFGPGVDDVPVDYLLQVQQQMFVIGSAKAYIPVLFDRDMFKIYEIHANDKIQKAIVQAALEMMRRLRECDPPDPDWEDPEVLDLLRRAYGYEPKKEIDLAPEYEEIFNNWMDERAKAADHRRRAEHFQALILHVMGDAATARIPGTDMEVVRHQQKPVTWTQDDVDAIKVGEVKRRGFIKVTVRKHREK